MAQKEESLERQAKRKLAEFKQMKVPAKAKIGKLKLFLIKYFCLFFNLLLYTRSQSKDVKKAQRLRQKDKNATNVKAGKSKGESPDPSAKTALTKDFAATESESGDSGNAPPSDDSPASNKINTAFRKFDHDFCGMALGKIAEAPGFKMNFQKPFFQTNKNKIPASSKVYSLCEAISRLGENIAENVELLGVIDNCVDELSKAGKNYLQARHLAFFAFRVRLRKDIFRINNKNCHAISKLTASVKRECEAKADKAAEAETMELLNNLTATDGKTPALDDESRKAQLEKLIENAVSIQS